LTISDDVTEEQIALFLPPYRGIFLRCTVFDGILVPIEEAIGIWIGG